MFKALKTARKLRRRRQDLNGKLNDLEKRYPEFDWKSFREITLFFSDKSLSSLNEQAFLYRLASQLPPDPTVIEIGSWIGHSACIIGSALRGPKARIYAIDGFSQMTTVAEEKQLFQNFLSRVSTTRSQRELFDEHVARFHLQDKVVAVATDSAEGAQQLPADFPGADLVFIDGGHTLEVVRQDIDLYVPRAKSGGIVMFHDFSSECGVPTGVWEEVQRGTFSELVGIQSSLIAFRKA